MAKAEKYYIVKYAVRGMGRFPLDMLRYDNSLFDKENDSIAAGRCGSRTVYLRRYSKTAKAGPCVARWNSFQWAVVEVKYGDEP